MIYFCFVAFRYVVSLKSPAVIFIMRGTTRMGHFSLAVSIYVKFCAKVEPLTKISAPYVQLTTHKMMTGDQLRTNQKKVCYKRV